VTHYVRHDDFLEDGILLRDADLLVDIPGVLVNGRFDLQAPIANAWELGRAWPHAEVVIVDNAGHGADDPSMTDELIRASDRFVRR
jgi:proline iminopeptidase